MITTPNSFRCPRCGTSNFTWQGLVAHKCDGVNREKVAPSPPHPLEKRRLSKSELAQAKEDWSYT
jgi:hypothetical protein